MPEDLKKKVKDVGKDLAGYAAKQYRIDPDGRVESLIRENGEVRAKNTTVKEQIEDTLDGLVNPQAYLDKNISQVIKGEGWNFTGHHTSHTRSR